jgi:hypothetical protein
MPALEELELETTGGIVTDADMFKIGRLRKLKALKLVGNSVTTTGLRALLTLPKLKHLSISRTRVGPDSIAVLAALPALQELDIETGEWGLHNQSHLYQIMLAKKVKLKQTQHEIEVDTTLVPKL